MLTYAMFPQVAPKFFGDARPGAEEPGQGVPTAAPQLRRGKCRRQRTPQRAHLKAPVRTSVTLNGKPHNVSVAPASKRASRSRTGVR